MKRILLLLYFGLFVFHLSWSQNVFSSSDPIVRYDKTMTYGSAQNPDTNKTGAQKWVSIPTTGISTGTSAWDASSFKAYFINLNGNKLAFRLKYPKSYNDPNSATKKYPVMIFLHGAGEVACSTNGGIYNNEKQLWLGGNLFMTAVNNNQFDGFLLYPQLVAQVGCWDAWGTAPSAKFTAIIAMVDELGKYARLDIDRVFVDGLSGGGYGAWRFADMMPQRIAKIAPSAAAGSTNNRNAFVHVPIWFATGGKDPDPSPAQAQYTLTRMQEIGADIRYTQYPDLGHAVWYTHWREPDFFTNMNDMHKANPLVFFGRNEFCSGQAINAKLGITAGFYAYEWQKDQVTIATRTNGVNTIVNGSFIITYAGNDITVNSFGTYRVRFKRTSTSAWSDWSPKPAVIKAKTGAVALPITVAGIKSKVLPALDGSTTVPLQLTTGFTKYEWVRVSDDAIVGNQLVYNSPVGVFKGRYNDQFGCPYSFSPNFTVINANGTPKPDPASGLIATALSLTSTRLNWTQNANETGFEIYRATTPGGPYQLLFITAANATNYTDNGLDANTTYYYVIRAVNATGAAVKSNEASPDNGNTAPVISALSDMYLKSNGSAVKNFTISDNPGDVLTVTIPLKPAFVTLQNTSGINYRITATPTINDVGWTDIQVVAKDNKGKSSTKTFAILVTDQNTRSVFVNFGSSSKTAPSPWNNWLGVRGANNTISNLKDESNATTTFSVTTITGWSTTTDLGHITGNNAGVYPDAVLQSGIADNGAAKQIRISGLNSSKLYNLVFVGSQNEGLNATTDYAIGSQKSTLNASYNTDKSANLNSLIPDAAGSLLVTITRNGTTAFSYLNALAIEEYSPSIILLNPSDLYAEPFDRSSVNLKWSDKTNNEDATGGYELQRATDAAFSSGVTTISLPGNTTSYKNSGLSSNTKYFYRVRAKSGGITSEYSNIKSTITPSAIIYVNFNTTIAGGPAPWNNLGASSTTTFFMNGLRNQSNAATSVGITMTKFFNGEFTAGRRTGNNSGVVPDNVLQSDFWLDNTQQSQFKLTGLNSSRRYRIGFFGSSSATGWFKGNYTATYTVNGRTVYLNSWENTTKIVYIGDLVPESGNVLFLNFSTTTNALYGFNGGIVIDEYSDGQGGTVVNSVLEPDQLNNILRRDSNFNVSVYPNPFNDIINLEFTNNAAGNRITAEVYDLAGRLVYRHDYNNLTVGRNTLRLIGIEKNKATAVCLVALKVNGKVVQSVKLLRSIRH